MNPIYSGLIYVVWFAATYLVVLLALAIFVNRHRLYEAKKDIALVKSSVSIVIPAYNEEAKIAQTIASVKQIKHDNISFIIVNDGSKDNTSTVVNKHIKGDARFVFIDRKENRGKAASLNEGIAKSNAEFIATIDADSIIEPDAFDKVLPYFAENKVGAVTVTVAVKEPKGLLHKLFEIEFMIGLSLFLKVFSFFDCIFVTPGPFSIYRKKALDEIGGFDVGNITEDHEIAFRLQKHGYRIENCLEAKVHTILPPTFKEIYVQRRRWYSGSLLTLHQHRKMLFRPKYGLFGYIIPFNYFLIFTGIVIFGFSIFLNLQNLYDYAWYIFYAGFNFDNLFNWNFDVLRLSTAQVFGFSGIFIAMGSMLFALIMTRKKLWKYKTGIVAYPLLYVLYQIFWIGAIVAVAKRKKISWR